MEEFNSAQFCGALTVMLSDSFGSGCLKLCGGNIDTTTDGVKIMVDDKIVEIDLKNLVS